MPKYYHTVKPTRGANAPFSMLGPTKKAGADRHGVMGGGLIGSGSDTELDISERRTL